MSGAIPMNWFDALPWRRGKTRRIPVRGNAKPRVPVAPVTPRWEGAAGVLRGLSIMAAGLVLAGALGWLWSVLSDPRTLPFKAVQIDGSFTHVRADAVRDAAAPLLKGNFFTVDVGEVQRAVEGLPWVRYAEVRRRWPDTVEVVITEQSAAALWGADALVNEAGEVFRPPRATFPTSLPAMQGPEGTGPLVTRTYRNLSQILAPLNVRITRLVLDDRRAWQLELDNGMQVMLGRGEPYARLLRFVRFYHRALQGRDASVERVDLRYGNGFAVAWKREAKAAKQGE